MTEKIPKCLLPVLGRPFVDLQLELLARRGIKDVVFCIGYLGDQVRQHLGDGKKWGVHVSYSDEGPNLLGTAGAIKKAESLLGDVFFLLYGDSYLLLDYQKIWEHFIRRQNLGMMVIYRNEDQLEKSNIREEKDYIVAYDKTGRTPGMNYINEGLSVLRKASLSNIPSGQSFSQEAFFDILIQRRELLAYPTDQRFYEMGSSSGLAELEKYLSSPGKSS